MSININQYALHQGTLLPMPIDKFLIKAAEHNFKNFSLWLPSLNEFLNSGHKLEEIQQIIAQHNLTIIEISPLHDWIAMNEINQESKISEMHKICNIAHELQAEFICAPTLGKNLNFELAVKNLITIADIASSYKVKVAVEFVTDQDINCLMAAWKLIQAANKDNVGILLDMVQFFYGPSKLLDLDIIPIEKIFLVHLCDIQKETSEKDLLTLVRNYRTFPGKGKLDLKSLISKLQQKNYSGYYSLEIFNKEFAKYDPTTIFQQAVASMCL